MNYGEKAALASIMIATFKENAKRKKYEEKGMGQSLASKTKFPWIQFSVTL